MKTISLTQGFVAVVDDADFEQLIKYKWYADVGQWTVYAKTDQLPNRPRMHVVIMQPTTDLIVHHVDTNGLHNWRDNLRITDQGVNTRFGKLRAGKRCKYRGVSWHNQRHRYVAEITINYKKYYLGIFDTQEEAALAYNKAGWKLLNGDFLPNIIEETAI